MLFFRKKCPIPATNKRFLLNTLVGTLSKSGNTKKRQLHEAEMNACKKRSEPNKSTGDNVVIKKSRRNIRTNCEQVKRSSHAPSNESRKKNCTVDTTSQSNS